jgi:PAS domain S-box-containing protein
VKRTTLSERALVLAPRGRDAAIAVSMLAEASIAAEVCASLPDLIRELDAGAGFVVVTEEALATADLAPIAVWIADQQEWSDLPFVLLTSHGGGLERNPAAQRYLDILGNVTFLERPFHPTTLISLARSALRARRRQYEARARLDTLRESEARFRAAVGAVEGVVWTNDAQGRMSGEQPGWAALTGQSLEAYQGYGWSKVVHPDDAQPTIDAWNDAVARRQTFVFEHRLRRHDGAWRLFSVRAVPTLDGSGAVREWVGIHTDITDERATAEALRAETEALETLNRTGAIVASELDRERVVQQVTTAGVELSGAAFGAFFYNVLNETGERYMLYALAGAERSQFDGFGMPRATAVFHPTFVGEGVVRVEDILSDVRYGRNAPYWGMPQGHLPVRSYLAVPVTSRSGEVLGGLFFGHPEPGRFTARHERLILGLAGQAAVAVDNVRLFEAVQRANETLEARVAERTAELTQAHEALRQAQKMEAMGQLTGGVAHDFNNLLTPIIGSLDRLVSRGVGSERERRLMAGALESADRAKILVQRLLAFARRQPLQTTGVDLDRLLNGLAGLITSTLSPKIDVRMEIEPGLPTVHADANQLEMALLNLAVNARDAMPHGGTLTIVAASRSLRDPHRSGLKSGAYVRLAVADTGTGMDEATRQRAIEPFFSTKGIGRGTGLGLSMVHGLAAQLGGGLTIQSEMGRGTTVELWLPVSYESPDEAIDGRTNIPELRLRGRALLVDDEALVRMSTADMLGDLGFEVIEFATAEEALELVRHGEPVDLLVTDHLMPGMSGADLAREVRLLRPELPVLVVSGYAEMDGITPNLPRLVKPFRAHELAEQVAALVVRGGAVAAH